MAYISVTTVKGNRYYRLVESYKQEGKVKHRIIENYGRTPPPGYVEKPVNATNVRATGVSATKVRATKVRATNVSATKVRTTEVRATEVRATKVRATGISAMATTTPTDFQIAVRKWAAESHETPDEYLARFAARKKNPLASNHDPTGQKRY